MSGPRMHGAVHQAFSFYPTLTHPIRLGGSGLSQSALVLRDVSTSVEWPAVRPAEGTGRRDPGYSRPAFGARAVSSR